jgi:hypothetical protein
MNISKKKLLSLVKENLEEMAMDFDSQDRPHPDIQGKLAAGDTPFKKVPLPKTGEEPNKNFQELLASERYKQVVGRVRQYTGVQTPMTTEEDVMPLARSMMRAHQSIIQTESQYKEELQQLAVKLVMKEMGIPEGSIEYIAKIVGLGEIDTEDFDKEMDQNPNIDEVDVEKDLFDELEGLDLERAKRRLINSMIQGASKKGHYMYHYVSDEIRQITGSDTLINNYGILMSVNDTLYWQLSDDTMKMMMGGGGGGGGEESVGGKEEVDRNSVPPKVYATGVNFPILVHELIKGTMELFAIQGQPEDPETFERVSKAEDTLEKEMWDLRLGPAIWDRIRSQFPEDILTTEEKYELQNYLLVEIFKLPPKSFLVLMKEVISGSEHGKRLIQEIANGVELMLKNEDYKDAMDIFHDDIDKISDETPDDDLKGFLGGLGIGLSGDDDDEE